MVIYGESGYQGYLKYEHIRDYVKKDPSRILFDFADILSYDNNGAIATETWNGHTYPVITPTNLSPTEGFHFSNAGSLRLAKAAWWMLARIAGWNGGTSVPVTAIAVTGSGGATTISTNGGTLQLSAAIMPSDATNKTVTWTISNGTGQASISASGLVTAIGNGTVTAKATAIGWFRCFWDTCDYDIGQVIPVTGITVTGSGGATTISTNGGTLQLSASNNAIRCHE